MQVADRLAITSLAFTLDEDHHSSASPSSLSCRAMLMAGDSLACHSARKDVDHKKNQWTKLKKRLKVIFYLFIYSVNTYQTLSLWSL